MANERLGIFEEVRERRLQVEAHLRRTRRKIVSAGPAPNGAYAQPANPFIPIRQRFTVPYYMRVHMPAAARCFGNERQRYAEGRWGLTVVQVVQACVLASDLKVGDIFSREHSRRVSWPRHVTMWAIDRYCPEYSYPEIAYIFDRDHTTVIYGINVTNERLARGCKVVTPLVADVRGRLAMLAAQNVETRGMAIVCEQPDAS